jgi:hypothetical protein
MSPDEIAQAAQNLYEERFRERFEGVHDGEFVVIDVINGDAYHGQYPEDALKKAQEASPDGTHHLIKIGSRAAFRIGFIGERNTNVERSLRSTG